MTWALDELLELASWNSLSLVLSYDGEWYYGYLCPYEDKSHAFVEQGVALASGGRATLSAVARALEELMHELGFPPAPQK